MVRRKPRTSFWCDTGQLLMPAALGLALIWGLHFALTAAFPRLWYDLQSVSVPDHAAGDDPVLTIDRAIRRDFSGRWTVAVRSAETHELVCLAPGPAKDARVLLDYRAAAARANPLRPTLSAWLRDADALAACEAAGFGPGGFYLTTCHTVIVAGFWPVKRCVDSPRFQRIAAG